MSDRETLDIYDARADDYARLVGTELKADKHLQHFLDLLPAHADVLDLGCGPGHAAAIMAQAGHTATATDASAEMVKLARQYLGVTVRQETFDDITGVALYDGIWANFSLLHAEPDRLDTHMAALGTALRPGGVFHIGMKTGDGTHRDSIGRRYTYVTQDSLTALLEQVGLTPLGHWTGREKGLAGSIDPWIIIQARKHG